MLNFMGITNDMLRGPKEEAQNQTAMIIMGIIFIVMILFGIYMYFNKKNKK